MSLVAHVYSYPKDEAYPTRWEDAAGYLRTDEGCWFAVADGAGSGYRSKEWARQIVEGFLDGCPGQPSVVQRTLLGQCDRWSAQESGPPTDNWWGRSQVVSASHEMIM